MSKTNNPNAKILPKMDEINTNAVGNVINKQNRYAAQKAATDASYMEKDKINRGFVWVSNGKTSKLVSPLKLEACLADGFKASNIVKK